MYYIIDFPLCYSGKVDFYCLPVCANNINNYYAKSLKNIFNILCGVHDFGSLSFDTMNGIYIWRRG